MRAEHVVLDTNVLISAILSPLGNPFACLNWVLGNATLIASSELLDEVDARLARPKFNKYLDASRRRSLVADLALAAVLVELHGVVKICRIPTTISYWRLPSWGVPTACHRRPGFACPWYISGHSDPVASGVSFRT
jgi:putative PIN family toxin of toxin-antitoxin system